MSACMNYGRYRLSWTSREVWKERVIEAGFELIEDPWTATANYSEYGYIVSGDIRIIYGMTQPKGNVFVLGLGPEMISNRELNIALKLVPVLAPLQIM